MMNPDAPDGKRNWFDQGGRSYAQFRPEYPLQLAKFLSAVSPSRNVAVDVGCGNGQLTNLLSGYFDQVVGIDPSEDQIAYAKAAGNVRYEVASAEKLPFADRSVSVLTAAQAAHWFDLPLFYAEARRVLERGGMLALISYGVLELEPALNERFQEFYWNEIGPYWPPERKLVDSGYANLDFPFDEDPVPAYSIVKMWNLDQFLGYISTWSAVKKVRQAKREDILIRFAEDLSALWGAPTTERKVTWPINMRLGLA